MDGLLSYKATSSLIFSSNCCFSMADVDLHLLSLLKERGFLPLSAALLSSSILRSEVGHAMDIFLDIASLIEDIILSLLFCRSGLIFLLLHPELCATLIISLRGVKDTRTEENVPPRYASMLISKGFVCRPREVGTIVEMHLRVVYAIDCLLTSTPNSEEFLWVLWELCGLSRSNCGRQALLALGLFPEAVSVLMEALHSVKEVEPGTMNSGVSPINLAIFHSAAEIFEVIVSDSTAPSLASWIEHAMELHKALHSSSPGSNRKDAPTRLLEWIDAGVVYHKFGAIGLLRYAGVLASGGDAHLSSTSMLVSDSMDVENAVGDSSNGTDVHVMENLAKTIFEKSFDGVTLRDSSVAQLTTAFRILAFISENGAVAAALYNEGAVTAIYAVLVNCRYMLERSSNSYDYLVDEGTECNSTSDLLLERNREQSVVDLLIPSLVLLITLLQKLQEANEQHRNTKLMNALLRLHREISPKLAACAADLSSTYPDSAINFGAVCHLLASALASWPIYGWTPGLFHSLLANVQATSLLALGPKETCSLLCLMNDLFPEEGVWLWKNGMPLLSALRSLAVGTLLGPQKERQVDWYQQPRHLETLLSQLAPQLTKIAQVILHYAINTLVVIQDMLRVFIIRVACQKAENASVLLRPIFSWICDRVSESSTLSETDAYKVHKLIDFLASLLEHPRAKPILLKEGAVQMLARVLERIVDVAILDGKHESRNSAKCGFNPLSWCLPVFKLFSLLFESRKSVQYHGNYDNFENMNANDCALIFPYLFKLYQVLPVGRELLACLMAFKEICSCNEGQSALVTFIWHIQSSSFEELESEKGHDGDGNYNIFNKLDWQKNPPLLWCWKKLLNAIDSEDGLSIYAVESVGALCLGALRFSVDGKSLNSNRIMALKYLFGLPCDIDEMNGFPEENIQYLEEMTTLLTSRFIDDNHSSASDMRTTLYQVAECAKTLCLLMQKPTSSLTVDDIVSTEGVHISSNYEQIASTIHQMEDCSVEKVDDYSYLGGLVENFMWECPETLPDRLSQTTLALKKKMSSLEGQSRRGRVDNSPAEIMAQSAFSRGSGPPSVPSGPTRRDTFRQRKPNTSRPPSMHVDDYVARERNVDGNASSNVIAVQRISSTGGRPPSIHVDEFMARQRERQNPVPMAVGEVVAQAKNVAPEKASGTEKPNKSRQLKTDLDDDLQGIDIVFDGEESEFDDKLPFPQPDDNLQQPPPAIVEQNSPHSIVAETEGDVNESGQVSHFAAPLGLNVDENTISSSRISASHPDRPLTREPSVSSDKKYTEQSDESNVIPLKTTSGFDSAAAAAASIPVFAGYNKNSASSVQVPVDNRMPQPNFYANNSLHQAGNVPLATGSQGHYDQKYLVNQPPLPPMPPPPTIMPVISQNSDHVVNHSSPFVSSTDVQPPLPTAFHVKSEYHSAFSSSSISLASSLPMSDSKYSRTLSSPSGSARPPPPLPPTPPPFTSNPFNLPSSKASTSHSRVYNQANVGTTELPQTSGVPSNDARMGNLSASGSRLTSYPPPPMLSPFVFSRPGSVPMNIYGTNSSQQQGENPSSMFQNLSIPQLQPLQPPLQPRPPQPPQHLRPPIQPSLQSEPGVSLLQNPVQLMQQPLQMLQQPQASPVHVYYQAQQQENYSRVQQQQIEHSQALSHHQQGDSASQQQQDPGISLQQYFSSPEAIQSLLSDRDKLCQLLEQHPKLMQMLQDKLGQL